MCRNKAVTRIISTIAINGIAYAACQTISVKGDGCNMLLGLIDKESHATFEPILEGSFRIKSRDAKKSHLFIRVLKIV